MLKIAEKQLLDFSQQWVLSSCYIECKPVIWLIYSCSKHAFRTKSLLLMTNQGNIPFYMSFNVLFNFFLIVFFNTITAVWHKSSFTHMHEVSHLWKHLTSWTLGCKGWKHSAVASFIVLSHFKFLWRLESELKIQYLTWRILLHICTYLRFHHHSRKSYFSLALS